MSLADLIRKRETRAPANANPAEVANDGVEPLAKLATLAFATSPKAKAATPADDRIAMAIGELQTDPKLKYAIQGHYDADPDVVILTVAIGGKGACELRIPKSLYDADALMQLIDRHTLPGTLQ